MVDPLPFDTFARDNLPPREQWPDLLLDGLHYPDQLNCVTALLDDRVAAGDGPRPCLNSPTTTWNYAELLRQVNCIANVLSRQLGMIPGNRVLLRAPNTPMMVAAYLAVIKAGGIAVATMPLLRARELAAIIDKARIDLALCDHRLLAELEAVRQTRPGLRVLAMGGASADDLSASMTRETEDFAACPTRADDVCLIAFTSGTTGEPKGTMHFHRDMLVTCDTYGAHVLRARADDIFIGSPPIAFTFGLGAAVLFPLRIGASSILLEQASPEHLLDAIRTLRPTVCFTAPTAYRVMLGKMRHGDLASLRICVSAGETLPKATWDAWHAATGLPIMDGIGATEMLHIFIGAPVDKIRPGATGLPVPGYQAKLIDDDGNDLPRGSTGQLAVRGPTGCRYLADARQTHYVRNGWNVTGDTYRQDEDGYFWYQARSDDMILSSGYNIAGPEVEAVLITHPAVAECGVVGAPDAARGMIVKAYVVLRDPGTASPELAQALQDHVKAGIAPYKYPRAVEFVASLPRGSTGKLLRHVLRHQAAAVNGAVALHGP
jgi:2-aminobenzoate-CoA ligase